MKLAKLLMSLSIVFAAMNTHAVKSWNFFGCFGCKDAVVEHGQKPVRGKGVKKDSKTKHPNVLKRSPKGGPLKRRAHNAAAPDSDSEDAEKPSVDTLAAFSFENPAYRAKHVMDAKIKAEQLEEHRLAARAVEEFVNEPAERAQARLQSILAPAESANATGEQFAA